jgi:glycosyltransferase involved in cell wall biosynthesis
LNNHSTEARPRVSVIIPSYNTAGLIAACLDSVFEQTFRDFEVIVVNDGSPDTVELEQVLRRYQPRIVYIRQENKRAAGARNTAIHRAQGEFLAFLDSDDSWLPNHLASQMELFAERSELDFVYSDAAVVSDNAPTMSFSKKCPSDGEPTFEALVVERCQIPISTVVVRKTALIKAGLFDETLARCDDYDMWLRTAFFGARMAYRRTSQARLYAGRPDSLGLSRSKMAEAYWKILANAARVLPLNPEQRDLVTHRAAEIRARYLVEEGKAQLRDGRPEKAREMFSEANRSAPNLKVSMMIYTLQWAPRSAGNLLAAWDRYRDPHRT